ncbi:MAG: JAB domain-containing protein [Cyclobacteriaceae bacterium]|jgi:DNA repair protein RadC|nr:JAB domain-containing protein [Cyclobacteriaceae bacterium]
MNVKPSQLPQVKTSRDAFDILLHSWDKDKIEFVEQFKVMILNRAQKVLGICEISQGGSSGTVADPKIIFALALKANASGIIVSHNHPSGNLRPSQADIDLTKKLKEGGKFLELQLLDHVIVTSEGYYSFADEGLV